MEGYCMKCHKKREMEQVISIKMKNGRPAKKGVCRICKTKMFRIGG